LSGINTEKDIKDDLVENKTKADESEQFDLQIKTKELNQEIEHLKEMIEFAKKESDEDIAHLRKEIQKIWDKIEELEKRITALEKKIE
jgi:seryl-tRNA synthetase